MTDDADETSGQRENQASWLFVFLFLLPLLLLALAFSVVAWLLACTGASAAVVRLFCLPASLLISNCLFVIPCFGATMLYEWIAGRPGYTLSELADFTLFPIWGPIVSAFWDWGVEDFGMHVPLWQVLLYQLVVYLLIGRFIQRLWAAVVLTLAGRE